MGLNSQQSSSLTSPNSEIKITFPHKNNHLRILNKAYLMQSKSGDALNHLQYAPSLQAFQSITIRIISFAPWYVSNSTLQNDFKIDTVNELATKHYKKFQSKYYSLTLTL